MGYFFADHKVHHSIKLEQWKGFHTVQAHCRHIAPLRMDYIKPENMAGIERALQSYRYLNDMFYSTEFILYK